MDQRLHISQNLRQDIEKANYHKCFYCSRDLSFEYEPVYKPIDSLVPQDQNGAMNKHNLVLSCLNCKNRKGQRNIVIYFKQRGFAHLPCCAIYEDGHRCLHRVATDRVDSQRQIVFCDRHYAEDQSKYLTSNWCQIM